MDERVMRAVARWPNVPAVYGWLALDRRGNWLLGNPAQGRPERIGNAALREYIGRNYQPDESGCWFFQNGPQRVYVALAYTPFVLRLKGRSLVDHCGRPTRARAIFQDDEGSILVLGDRGIGLLDDRDLLGFVEASGREVDAMPVIARRVVPERFGFVAEPRESAADSLR